MADSLEMALMPGQVIEGHAKLEAECKNCHVRFNKAAQTGLCLDCHKDVARDVQQRRGHHGRIKEQECRLCHTDHKGRAMNIAPLDEKTFDHRLTDFELKNAHAAPKVACRDCHEPKAKFRDAPSDCVACHRKDDKHKGSLGEQCADCHTDVNWKKTKFDHSKTKFPLTGKHVDVACKACHSDPKFKGAPLACVACHKKDDDKKGHRGKFGTKCETCHTDRDWKSSKFDHDRDTKYPLKGRHIQTKCTACHTGVLYREMTPTTCVACHRKDDDKKGHKGKFGEKCQSCHVEKDWKVIVFNHDRDTKYPLRGGHIQTKCASCHTGFLYKDKTPTACVACHRKDDDKKGHKGKFGDKCQNCHVEKDWKTTSFNHDRDTKYPLRGKHIQVKCSACHKDPLYKDKTPTTCFACHEKDDKHKGQEGKQCESCHNERSWKETRFDHGLSRFPLLGKHAQVKCKECHATPAFKDAKRECHACHQKDDTHKLKLGPACEQCHNARDWKQWSFDHDRRTNYKLDGKHKGLHCHACHRQPMPNRVRAPSNCSGCHSEDDVHNGGFGRVCEQCHVTDSFKTIKAGAGRLPR